MQTQFQIIRGKIFHFLKPHASHDKDFSYEYLEDGILWIENGLIKTIGPTEILLKQIPTHYPIKHYPHALITPGFIDTHIHFPQIDIIASYGEQLLQWLERYTFPCEKKFGDCDYGDQVANVFLKELLRNGTTTAMVFPTVHPMSVDALFETASAFNMRLLSGKVMIDCNAPEIETPQKNYEDTQKLIHKWHNHKRLSYAVTPRFALTASEDLLHVTQKLLHEFPDIYLQTHLAENIEEVKQVKKLFPWAKTYLDIYDRFELLGSRSVFAHAIHLDDRNYGRLSQTDSTISFCPASNLFLGSGLFNIKKALQHECKVTIGSDVGGGNHFSLLRNLSEAYKVGQLQGFSVNPLRAFYWITLGAAHALKLDKYIGNFETGKEADFLILNCHATDLLKYRMQQVSHIDEILFLLMMLGDDRVIQETYLQGKLVHTV